MHLLPTCQGVALLAVSMVQIYHGGRHPLCPKQVWLTDLLTADTLPIGRSVLCGLAGALVLVWPLLVLTVLIVVANNLFLRVVFMREKSVGRAESVWHGED